MQFRYGTNYNDEIRANLPDSFTIYGYGGHDTLIGREFDDRIFGGDGDDAIIGDLGNDSLYGGNGFDTIEGGGGNDLLLGGSGDDDLYGDTGNDLLKGESGWDYMVGGRGNDTLIGGSGGDFLAGGDGNDVLDGGFGDDDLFGNAGFDEFRFADNGGFDIITGFQLGTDQIRFDLAGISDFNDVMDFAYRDHGDTVFDFGQEILLVENIRPGQFDPSDFIFV